MIFTLQSKLPVSKVFGIVYLITMILLFPLQAQDKLPKVQQFEGKLTFHQDMPVDMVSGTVEHPQLIEVNSIRFETKYGNSWGVAARIGWLPVKDAAWRLTIELLDEKGQVLRHPLDKPIVFTCKSGAPGETKMLYADLDLEPM